jgi:biopolymer transport protein ExbB
MTRSVLAIVMVSILLGPLGAATAWSADDAKPDGLAGMKSSGFSVDEAWNELKRQMEAGGTTNWVIVFLSIIGVAFIIERAFRLRRKYIVPVGFAEQSAELWRAGQFGELIALCEAPQYAKTPMAQIIGFMARHRRAPIDNVNEVAGDIASRHMDRHNMLNYPVITVATLSPLLGLFGTVVGMIEAFDTVTLAGQMGDPTLLSGSISKALITTEFGLVVAIPMIFFYAMNKTRTSYLFNTLEEQASTLIAEWYITATEPEANHAVVQTG